MREKEQNGRQHRSVAVHDRQKMM